MFDWLYGLDILVLYPATLALVLGAAWFGNRQGLRMRRGPDEDGDVATLTGAALGLLALLIAFSFSMAENRFDQRRAMVLEEANAIGTAASYAMMLPEAPRGALLGMLRDYALLRAGLGVPYDPARMEREIAAALALQGRMWGLAAELGLAAPQSLAVHRFVGALNEVTNMQERRLSALRGHVPSPVIFILIATACIGMGFSGFNAGVAGAGRVAANTLMSATIALLIILIIDLDRPHRGLIEVPVQPLLNAAAAIAR